MLGQRRCRLHGGASPQAKASARERLRAAAMPAVDTLIRALAQAREERDINAMVKAACALLDRTGYHPRATAKEPRREATKGETVDVKGLTDKAQRWMDGIRAVHNIEEHQEHILMGAARALDEADRAEAKLRRLEAAGDDSLVAPDGQGVDRERPEVKIASAAMRRHASLVRELGLQPGEGGSPVAIRDAQGDGAPRKIRLVGRTERRGA